MSISANFPNVKPSLLLDFANAQQLPPAVTFTRATTAVYYNGSTTAMAEQNLYVGSQDFSNAGWSTQSAGQSVTVNSVAAPDGTTTADTLIEPSSGSNVPRWYQIKTVTANTPYTVSCYLKANTRTFGYLQLEIISVGNVIQYFNLSTGAASTLTTSGSSSGVSNTITSVGSGWYRCTLTATFPTGTSIYPFIGLADSTPNQSYTTNGSSLYAWGAQFEQRASATAYTATTTAAITNYVPVLLTAGGGQPRFDHNPTTGESLGLLIEEARTNVATYSSEFSPNWGNNAVTVQLNVNVAPDGTQTADCLVPTTASTIHYVYPPTGTLTISTVYTYSVYAKANGFNYIFLQGNDGGGSYPKTFFNLSNGTIAVSGTGYTNSITSVGNGWYRCSITFTTSSTSGSLLALGVSDTTNVTSTGNGFSGIYAWGAQVEVGTCATSYIATTSAAATRAADSAQMTGANFTSWYSQGFGTLYAEYAHLQDTGASTVTTPVEMNDGTQNKFFQSGPYTYASNTANVFTRNASSLGANSTTALISRNGSTLGPYTDSAVSIGGLTLLVLGIGRIYYPFPVRIKKVSYYPIVATQAQLNALTS
jgi:hypothetical protein